jgi:hypothetical protein
MVISNMMTTYGGIQDDRPVVRHVQGQPGTDRAPRDAADEREHADRADGLVERILELVARHR